MFGTAILHEFTHIYYALKILSQKVCKSFLFLCMCKQGLCRTTVHDWDPRAPDTFYSYDDGKCVQHPLLCVCVCVLLALTEYAVNRDVWRRSGCIRD